MNTVYAKTDKYALNLYGDNDPADLREGYNDSMRTIDDALETHRGRIEGVKYPAISDTKTCVCIGNSSRADKTSKSYDVPDNVNALSCNDSGLFISDKSWV